MLDTEKQDTATGDNGRFSFSKLKPGQYQIAVEMPGFSRYASSVRIGAAEHVLFPAIMLEPTYPCFSVQPMAPAYRVHKIPGDTVEITGRIVPPQQADVELKTIIDLNVSTVHATADKHGEFRFSQVRPGHHRLYVTPAPDFVGVNPMDVISHPGERLVIAPIRLRRPLPPSPGQAVVVCE